MNRDTYSAKQQDKNQEHKLVPLVGGIMLGIFVAWALYLWVVI